MYIYATDCGDCSSLLACARIGVVHSVVFGGFSAKSLSDRIQDAECKIVINANEGLRGGKIVPIKNIVDQALESCPGVNSVIVVKRTDSKTQMLDSRDVWYHDEIKQVSNNCPVEEMHSSDPLFILYTSGSTGKPKGIYMAQQGIYYMSVCRISMYLIIRMMISIGVLQIWAG